MPSTFDHTLVEGDTALEGAKRAINFMRERGHELTIYSCNNVDWIKRVMNNNDLRYDRIWGERAATRHKPVADLYIDDRGYHFKGNWDEEITAIMERLRIR